MKSETKLKEWLHDSFESQGEEQDDPDYFKDKNFLKARALDVEIETLQGVLGIKDIWHFEKSNIMSEKKVKEWLHEIIEEAKEDEQEGSLNLELETIRSAEIETLKAVLKKGKGK